MGRYTGPTTRLSRREGINLQFARVLFNHNLPWNPMDVEQRIGRIHRYGQKDTAQVYNLVLSDTIEGSIYLLLTDKLLEIARTLGKVDEQGNVTEDLRSQILGQLSDRLKYDQLYRDALSDPEDKIPTTKQRQIERVARAWLAAHREPDCAYRFDAVSVVQSSGRRPSVRHIIEAFIPSH